jgi:hypothetical protein
MRWAFVSTGLPMSYILKLREIAGSNLTIVHCNSMKLTGNTLRYKNLCGTRLPLFLSCTWPETNRVHELAMAIIAFDARGANG